MMARLWAVALGAAMVTGCTTLGEGDRVPLATNAGEPVDCLPLQQIRETRVRSDEIIDFYTNGGRVYRNTLPNSCPTLGFERRFSYSTSLTQLCSVDIITVLTSPPTLQGASCGLGKFQPVDLANR